MSCSECVLAMSRLCEEISALRIELRQLGLGQAGNDDAELVAAAHAGLSDRAFVAAELLARSLTPDAIGARLAALLAGRSVRSIGKSLARAANRRTDSGMVLRRLGSSNAGVIWHCQSIKLTNTRSACTNARAIHLAPRGR